MIRMAFLFKINAIQMKQRYQWAAHIRFQIEKLCNEAYASLSLYSDSNEMHLSENKYLIRLDSRRVVWLHVLNEEKLRLKNVFHRLDFIGIHFL